MKNLYDDMPNGYQETIEVLTRKDCSILRGIMVCFRA